MGGESGIFSTPDTFGTRLGTRLGTPSWGHPPPTWGRLGTPTFLGTPSWGHLLGDTHLRLGHLLGDTFLGTPTSDLGTPTFLGTHLGDTHLGDTHLLGTHLGDTHLGDTHLGTPTWTLGDTHLGDTHLGDTHLLGHPPRGTPTSGTPTFLGTHLGGHPPRGHPLLDGLGDTHLGRLGTLLDGLGDTHLGRLGTPTFGGKGRAKEQAEQAAQRRSSDTCRAAWAPKVYWRPAIGQPNACLISDESASPVVLRIPRLSRRCAECGSF